MGRKREEGDKVVVPLKPVPGAGEAGVRDTIRAGRRLARRDVGHGRDPDIGQPMTIDGHSVPPGQWTPGPDGLAPGCPVQVLGMNGDTLYLIDAMGQLAAVEPNALGQKFVQRLVGDRQKWLYWAFPRYDRKGGIAGWRNELFCEMVYSAAAKRDLWNAEEQVRGRGAWRTQDGNLLWHAGDALYRAARLDRDGSYKPEPTGESEGYFYPRRPATFAPWSEPIAPANNPALDIYRRLETWQWERPKIDPVLMLGWIGAALLGAALPWRPACFVVGDRAVGKSQLNLLLKDILGPALLDTADTTPAGIYQRVRQDCLPVAVDELEADADNRRALGVVRLARIAASGGRMNRGGADHTGTEFTARSCFFFSAINPPPMPAQDLSRLVMLHLRRLPAGAPRPERIASYAVARMLLRQLMDNWCRFDAAWDAYREALAAGGHDGRGQDTYGTALACADLLLGPDIMDDLGLPVDDLRPWSDWLAARTLPEMQEAHENWRQCLTHLLTSRVEAWREGHRRTVGQVLDDCESDANGDRLELAAARRLLAQAGLGLLDGRKHGAGFILAVPHAGPLVAALFRDTVWAGTGSVGGWQTALRQGPPEVILRGPPDKPNWNVRKVAGVAVRCTLVSLDGFRRLTET